MPSAAGRLTSCKDGASAAGGGLAAACARHMAARLRRRGKRTAKRLHHIATLPGVVLLGAGDLRRALDPAAFRTLQFQTTWLQCRNAAATGLMACCNLSAMEVTHLLADDYMPLGQAIIVVRHLGDPRGCRTVPLIDAVVCVVKRYLDARPEELARSRHLLVQPDGRPVSGHVLLSSIKAAGRRLGLTSDLPASLKATFRAAVDQDPVRDGASHHLLRLNPANDGIAMAGAPQIARLRRLLAEYHPLAPYKRIRYFDTEEPPPTPLLAEIRACGLKRTLDAREIQSLRRTRFPEVFKLWQAGLVTKGQAARWFGTDDETIHSWTRQFKAKGPRGIRGYKLGNMTPEWRTTVTEEFARRSPIRSFTSFYEELKAAVRFPYSFGTLLNFMRRNDMGPAPVVPGEAKRRAEAKQARVAAEPPPCAACLFPEASEGLRRHLAQISYGSPQGRIAWRQVLVREAQRRRPKSNRSFHTAMRKELGFPRGEVALRGLLLEGGVTLGWLHNDANVAEWRRRLVCEVIAWQPTDATAFHREMAAAGFPRCRRSMRAWLAAEGIRITRDGPTAITGARTPGAAARDSAPHNGV